MQYILVKPIDPQVRIKSVDKETFHVIYSNVRIFFGVSLGPAEASQMCQCLTVHPIFISHSRSCNVGTTVSTVRFKSAGCSGRFRG